MSIASAVPASRPPTRWRGSGGTGLPRSSVRRRRHVNDIHDYLRDGAAIYERSFAIIRAEADLARFPADVETVAVRMIHACGMVDLVDDIAFSAGVGRSAGRR